MRTDSVQHGKFCILVCGHITADLEERYGDFGQMFEQMLREAPEEQWDLWYPVDGQWPSPERFASYQGIAVTGSVSDSFDTVPWIVRLRKELAAASQRKQRLLGICFGCQALAIALGGVAERAKVAYEIGTRHIHFFEAVCSGLETPWAGACPKDGQLVIHESHQDCVTHLPEGAFLLASSRDTHVEVWALGDHVLCIQGHPEFSIDFMEVLVQWKAEHTPDTFPPELADATVTELRTDPVTAKDAAAWHHLCRTFLKNSDRFEANFQISLDGDLL